MIFLVTFLAVAVVVLSVVTYSHAKEIDHLYDYLGHIIVFLSNTSHELEQIKRDKGGDV